jgi:DNA-binding IclR family transcriptional regulator
MDYSIFSAEQDILAYLGTEPRIVSAAQIAYRTRWCRRTVQRHLARLRREGKIQQERDRRGVPCEIRVISG